LPRKYCPSSTSDRYAQQPQQRLDEQVDEPHDRLRDAQHRRERIAHHGRDAVGVRRADDLGRDLREHEERERDRYGAKREGQLALAEEALGDHGRQRRRAGRDERVSQQDHAQQPLDLRQQRDR
jgi:hypothetical protein